MANSAIDDLRSDFEIYKTQVSICAWCGVAVLIVVVCALIYAIFAVRKVRRDLEDKIKNLETARKFTINRPKVYSSSDPTSKLQGEIGKALSVDSRDSKEMERRQPSPLATPTSPTSTPTKSYLNHGYTDLNSPGLTSLYSNLNSPNPNINLRSPSPNYDKNTNRVENFLNKTRQLYSNNPSPRLPRTPTGSGNRDSSVFKFS